MRSRFGSIFALVGGLRGAGLQAAAEPQRTVSGHDIAGRSAHEASTSAAQMLGRPIFWLMFAHDDDDVDERADGDVADGRLHDATSAWPTCVVFGLPLLPLALSLDRITNGAHAPVLRLGVRSDRPREHDARSPSVSKARR